VSKKKRKPTDDQTVGRFWEELPVKKALKVTPKKGKRRGKEKTKRE